MNKTATIILTCMLSLVPVSSQAKESIKKPITKSVVKTTQKAMHTCAKKDSSRTVLACNIYKEARGEGVFGMLAVGFVTLNRLDHDKFPASVRGVVYQKKQFSWTIYKNGLKIYNKESWEQAQATANFLLLLKKGGIVYNVLDFTMGSLYYHTHQVKPVWRHKLSPTVTVGNHTFYKDKQE